jgi:quercetin dioxygenase-like cupin family protein
MKSALLCLILLTAQATEVEITSEPDHHLTFENKSVRVFNVEVPAHSETLMHWHRHDYIYVILGAAEIENAVKDKPPITVKLQDGETRFSAAPFAHIARNLTDHPFRNVTIEILEDAALRNAPSKWDAAKNEDRALDILQGGTRQILFVKDGIRVSEVELQPGAVVPMQHHAGSYLLLVAVTDLNLRDDNVRNDEETFVPGSFTLDLGSGGQTWLPSKALHYLTNVGKNPAKVVTLEFP